MPARSRSSWPTTRARTARASSRPAPGRCRCCRPSACASGGDDARLMESGPGSRMRRMKTPLAVLLLAVAAPALAGPAAVHPIQEGFVDVNGALVYYMEVGEGDPLVIVHGGPGASHDYLLPGL